MDLIIESHGLADIRPNIGLRILFVDMRLFGRMRHAQGMRQSAGAIFLWIYHQQMAFHSDSSLSEP